MKVSIIVAAFALGVLFAGQALAQSASPPRNQPAPPTIAESCDGDAECEAALEERRRAEEAEAQRERAARATPGISIGRLPRCPNTADPRCPTGDPQANPRGQQPSPQSN